MLRPRSEAGFTLVELLLAVVILGIITLPLGDLVISAFKHTDATGDRLDLSHDAQLASSYFGRDVAAVGLRDYDDVSTGALKFKPSVLLDSVYAGCATAVPATLVLLSDEWDTGTEPAERRTRAVAYYLTGAELRRKVCPGAGASTDTALAHHVKTGSVAVTCSSACTAAAVPERITLRLVSTKPSVGDYPITLDGQRRQS